jgi:predicted dehydrogenase
MLVRHAIALPCIVHGYDPVSKRVKTIKTAFPSFIPHPTLEHLFADTSVGAVIVATPPATHYALAAAALAHGKHVLVEKPLTQNGRDARLLVTAAKRTDRLLMTDHTFCYSPAVIKAKQLIGKGVIGSLIRIESVRNGGRPIPESTALWDLGVHDVALAHLLLPTPPVRIQTLASPTQNTDIAHFILANSSGIAYYGSVNWTQPIRERRLTLVGSTGSLTITWDGPRELLMRTYRGKTARIVTPRREPLTMMLATFLARIRTHDTAPGIYEERIITCLEALHYSWRSGTVRRIA